MTSNLFQCFNFLIVEDDKENKGNIQKVTHLLEDFKYNNIYTFHVKDLPNLTNFNSIKKYFIKKYNYKNIHFIISNNISFPFYKIAAFDYLIPVVSIQWIKECIHRNHLLRTLNFSPDPRHILKNTTIYIVRSPNMSHTDYRFYSEIVTTLGGVCVDALTKKVTHIIATSCFDPNVIRICQMIQNVRGIKIVYPTWLLDCFKSLKYIDEMKHKIDLVINDDNGKCTHIDERFEDLWEDLETSSVVSSQSLNKKYLQGHTFIIDLDLSLSSKIYKFLIQLIKSYGGNFVPYIKLNDIETNKDIDCFIGESTNTESFELCRKRGIYTGNIIWFFNLWSFDTFIEPQRKMIWGPFKAKIFKSNDLILSHTNYFGQERIYIQKLVESLGGSTTTSFSSHNTHLLVKVPFGKKFTNATTKRPNCKVINHRWLENCYFDGVILDTDKDQFKDFNICEKGLSYFLNQMGDDIQDDAEGMDSDLKLHELTGSNSVINDSVSSSEETDIEFSTANENQVATLVDYRPTDKRENVDTKRDEIVNLAMLHDTNISQNGNNNLVSNQVDISLQNKGGEKEVTEKDPYQELFGVLSQSAADSNINDAENSNINTKDDIDTNKRETPSTPLVSRQSSTNKEKSLRSNQKATNNEVNKSIGSAGQLANSREEQLTPPINNAIIQSNIIETPVRRRAARTKAEKRLHEDIESLNEFERNKRKKRIRNLLPSEIETLEHSKELKNKAKDIILSMKGLSNENDKEEALKKLKHSYNIKAFVTGCHENISELDIEILSLLGITITEEYKSNLNCIIAPKRLRTAKFLSGLSFHPLEHILSPEFITKILEYVYHKDNPVGIIKYEDFRLKEIDDQTLEKTKLNNKLFERAHITNINISPDITGGFETVSSILMNHGIKKIQKIGKNPLLINNHPHKRISLLNGKVIHPPRCIIVSGSKPNLRKWRKQWSSMNNNSVDELLITTWDWCVDSIFKLDVDYNDKKNVLYSSL